MTTLATESTTDELKAKEIADIFNAIHDSDEGMFETMLSIRVRSKVDIRAWDPEEPDPPLAEGPVMMTVLDLINMVMYTTTGKVLKPSWEKLDPDDPLLMMKKVGLIGFSAENPCNEPF